MEPSKRFVIHLFRVRTRCARTQICRGVGTRRQLFGRKFKFYKRWAFWCPGCNEPPSHILDEGLSLYRVRWKCAAARGAHQNATCGRPSSSMNLSFFLRRFCVEYVRISRSLTQHCLLLGFFSSLLQKLRIPVWLCCVQVFYIIGLGLYRFFCAHWLPPVQQSSPGAFVDCRCVCYPRCSLTEVLHKYKYFIYAHESFDNEDVEIKLILWVRALHGGLYLCLPTFILMLVVVRRSLVCLHSCLFSHASATANK
jgi:hypothetical protein